VVRNVDLGAEAPTPRAPEAQILELSPNGKPLRIVCVSDTHGRHDQIPIPPGDIFIHAGDFSRDADLSELRRFDEWLGTLPHRHKVVIAGNHDLLFGSAGSNGQKLLKNAIYLKDQEVIIEGVKIYGSPVIPKMGHGAFELKSEVMREQVWKNIPDDTDVLVTHTPPHGIRDTIKRGWQVGCEPLALRVRQVQPRLHVFGHIHEAYGVEERDGTTYANAAMLGEGGKTDRSPLVFELPRTALKPHQLLAALNAGKGS
jgi:predicted phosphohydrolase